nr:MAG: VP4 protein [Drosophila Glencorse burn reovirus]
MMQPMKNLTIQPTIYVESLREDSQIRYNLGSVIPVNPLDSGSMLLANATYQLRNMTACLSVQARLTKDVLGEIMHSMREMHVLVQHTDSKCELLFDMIDNMTEEDQDESEAGLCEYGAQALSIASAVCYTIPGINVAFGSLFSYASDLVSWYGENVRKSNKWESFNMRRTALFDNVNTAQYNETLKKRFINIDDKISKLEYMNEWLTSKEMELYETEKWILDSKQLMPGYSFYGLVNEHGKVDTSTLGISHPSVTPGYKSLNWTAIDLKSNAIQSGILQNTSNFKKDSLAVISHHLKGSQREFRIERMANTPIFIPDTMIDERLKDLRHALPHMSSENVQKLSQIHAFLQLGGSIG